VAQASVNDREFGNTHGQLALSNVLSPLPAIPDEFTNRWVYGQAPATAMAWALVAFALVFVLQRRGAGRVGLAVVGLMALAAGLLLLIIHPHWWLHFPRLVKTVQFPFRLIPYLAMLTALATVLGLTTLRGRARQWMTGLLVAVVAVQAGAGVWLVIDSQPSGSIPVLPAHPEDLPVGSEPTSFAAKDILVQLQFRVAQRPYGGRPNHPPVTVDLGNLLTGDIGKFKGVGRVGERMMVPVVWSPLVHVTGDARIAGRDWGGASMIAVTHTDAGGAWRATVEAAHPWPVVAGRIVSLLSALAIAALALAEMRRGRRRRRPAPPVAEAPVERRPAVGV
jgi:hypothetical protein